jgi:Ca-activated chloride channel family protein
MTTVEMHPETAVGELKAGTYNFPLQAVDVRGNLKGLLYSATVTQKFKNERNVRLEAVYLFPLPPKAAVHGFTLKVGDRVIEGEIKERGQARRDYQEAVSQGHRAAMLEEERSDIFTTTVGNIGPGEEVEIRFELSGPLSCFKNTARLRLPLVVGEVFIPGRELAGNSVGDGVHPDTDEVPDASRITPPRLADGAPNPVALSVSFTVDPSGLQVSDVASTCHFARTRQYRDGRYKVSLLPGVERMDRAFVLEVTYPEKTLQTGLLIDSERKAFALTVVPPVVRERSYYPRDVVIVLDRSGSMSGWSMVAARRAAARIVDSLTEEDRFGLIAFDNVNEHYDQKQGLCPANNFHKMRAAQFLSKIEARGGTMTLPALLEGLDYLSQREGRDPHVILLTDGDVGNDSQLIRSCQTGVRISTVGIGYAAREGLLNRMAETSGGVCSLIPNESELEKELVEMHRKWGQPVWKGLSLKGQDANFKSPKFWDVWQDIPTTFFGRMDELPESTEVSGWFEGRGEYRVELQPEETSDPVVYRAWARSRLLDLEDLFLVYRASPAELVRLSVDAQVLCRFTAFTAIDKSERVDTGEELEKVVQPVEQTIQRDKEGKLKKLPSVAPSRVARMQKRSYSAGAAVPGGPPAAEATPPMAPTPASMPVPELAPEPVLCELCEPVGEAPPAPPMEACMKLDKQEESFGGFRAEASSTPKKPVLGKSRKAAKKLGLRGGSRDQSLERQATDSLQREFKELLRQQDLLSVGTSVDEDLLKKCLATADKLQNRLSKLFREGAMASERVQNWKKFLSKLMDYKEALEEALEGESVAMALQLRAELEDLLAGL